MVQDKQARMQVSVDSRYNGCAFLGTSGNHLSQCCRWLPPMARSYFHLLQQIAVSSNCLQISSAQKVNATRERLFYTGQIQLFQKTMENFANVIFLKLPLKITLYPLVTKHSLYLVLAQYKSLIMVDSLSLSYGIGYF